MNDHFGKMTRTMSLWSCVVVLAFGAVGCRNSSKESVEVPASEPASEWPASLCSILRIDPASVHPMEALVTSSHVDHVHPILDDLFGAQLRAHAATITAYVCRFDTATAFDVALVDLRTKQEIHRLHGRGSTVRQFYVVTWIDDRWHVAWIQSDGSGPLSSATWTPDGVVSDRALAKNGPVALTGGVGTGPGIHVHNCPGVGFTQPLGEAMIEEVWSWNGPGTAFVAAGECRASSPTSGSVSSWPNPILALIAYPLPPTAAK